MARPNDRHTTPTAQTDARSGREQADPGAYIGRKPERVAETIPGGVGRHDQRASATASRPTAPELVRDEEPTGHRDGPPADDAEAREAGENR
jgi:hypothetical protein